VLACPGSGKTHTAIAKASVILAQSPNNSVCLISFTRDSAREIKSRLAKVLETSNPAALKRTLVGTFHSLFIRHLSSHKKLSRILSPGEQESYVVRTQKECGLSISVDQTRTIIESCKTSYENIIPKLSVEERKVYLTYQELLQRNKVMDLQDVLVMSARLLSDPASGFPPLPVTHLLIDEYQDVDPIQYQIIVSHALSGIITTVVGDDDQAIYGWRNAMGCLGMEKFQEATGAKKITLAINYRCMEEILSAADRLIFNNKTRYAKRLEASRGQGGKVHLFRIPTRADEANDLRSRIQIDHSRGLREKEWAVLSRTNRILDVVEAELSTKQIPFKRSGKSFWQGMPQRHMLSFLRCMETGEKNGIDQILHWAGFNKAELDLLHKDDENFAKLLSGTSSVNVKDYPPALQSQLSEFLLLLPAWRNLGRSRSDQSQKHLLQGFCNWMKPVYSNQKKDKNPDALAEKKRLAAEFIALVETNLLKLPGSFAQREALLTGADGTEKKHKGGSEPEEKPVATVALLTFHGSKGLEFEKVWIIGANSTVTPGKSINIEEERRLFYVGVTRAKNELFISSAMDGNDNSPSLFLAELRND